MYNQSAQRAQSNRGKEVSAALRRLLPRIPAKDAAEVLDQALQSRGLKQAKPETAAWLSAVAYIRHNFTDYEAMLEDGYGIEAARHFCLEGINAVLGDWGSARLLTAEEEG